MYSKGLQRRKVSGRDGVYGIDREVSSGQDAGDVGERSPAVRTGETKWA